MIPYGQYRIKRDKIQVENFKSLNLNCNFTIDVEPQSIGKVDWCRWGVWLSFLSAELGTVLISYYLVRKSYQKKRLDTEQREKSLW